VQRTATFLVPDAAYTSGASLAEQQAILTLTLTLTLTPTPTLTLTLTLSRPSNCCVGRTGRKPRSTCGCTRSCTNGRREARCNVAVLPQGMGAGRGGGGGKTFNYTRILPCQTS
jgi:hypothetical protein